MGWVRKIIDRLGPGRIKTNSGSGGGSVTSVKRVGDVEAQQGACSQTMTLMCVPRPDFSTLGGTVSSCCSMEAGGGDDELGSRQENTYAKREPREEKKYGLRMCVWLCKAAHEI